MLSFGGHVFDPSSLLPLQILSPDPKFAPCRMKIFCATNSLHILSSDSLLMKTCPTSITGETSRSSGPDVFYKKSVLRNFAKSTGKHLCQSLLFNKVVGLRTHSLQNTSGRLLLFFTRNYINLYYKKPLDFSGNT